MTELHAVAHGMVQGVWFRGWTREVAHELRLSGWVCNRPDGAVEILARGGRKILETFLDRLYDGPPLARVSSVETSWAEVSDTASETAPGRFSVRF